MGDESTSSEHRVSDSFEKPKQLESSVDQLEKQATNSKPFFESDAGDGSKREDHYLHGTQLALCLLSLFLCLFLFALDQTIISTLLTEVGNKFNSFDKIGWLASGFFLSMTVFVATWGRLSIIFGRKSTMYVAITLFEAGSLMCALANNMNVLIGGRVLAGIGGGGIQSLVFIIMTEIVPINVRPLGMAALSSVFAVASVLGPLIGGAFTSNVSWRWCFYINLPIGGIAVTIFTFFFNPPKIKTDLKAKLGMIDYVGTILLVIGMVVFLLALTFGSGNSFAWDSGAVISCFVIGGIFIVLFGVWNFNFSKNPTIPKEVVMVPQVVACAVMIFAMFGYFMATLLYISIYFQVIHGADGWHTGINLLPMIVAVVVASMSTGIISNKFRIIKPFGVIGAVLGPIAIGLLCLIKVKKSNPKDIGFMILLGASCGMQMQPTLIGAQISAPKVPGGIIMATTFINFFRSLGGTMGATLSDTVYSSSFTNKLKNALDNSASEHVKKEIAKIGAKSLVTNTSAISSLSPETQYFVKSVVLEAIKNVFYMSIGFASLCVISSLFVTNKRLPKSSVGVASAEGGNKKADATDKDDGKATDGTEEVDEQSEVQTANEVLEPSYSNRSRSSKAGDI